MAEVLQRLNIDLEQLVARAGSGLVRVSNGTRGTGAGTVWHPDGLILTNAHVIRTSRLHITLPDGRRYPAQLLAADRNRDLAALSVEAEGLPAYPLGQTTNLQPGQWVLAMGHPLGVQDAATLGVVIGRGSDLPERPAFGGSWLAVDLHYRLGHSGGPLVDMTGCLVGVNTIMAGPNVGLAIPVEEVKAFLKEQLGRE